MNAKQTQFEIDFLDHVAIRVKDLDVSVAWYARVLGLKKHHPSEWHPFPVFMLNKKSGVALFPIHSGSDSPTSHKHIDHFAFNVSNVNFEKAIKRYDELDLKHSIEDHHYFKSLYTKDPDGYVVELTTIQVDENAFYNLSSDNE